jgi:peptide/nickel transport system permease protein
MSVNMDPENQRPGGSLPDAPGSATAATSPGGEGPGSPASPDQGPPDQGDTRHGDRGTALWVEAFGRLRRSPMAIAGGIIIALFIIVAIIAPWIAPYGGTDTPGMESVTPTDIPGIGTNGYPLGLDNYGGDVLSKLIWGARASLLVGVISTVIGLVGGLILGALAGGFGGWVDTVIMRIVDILLSVPNLLMAVSIAAIAGQTPFAVMVAIGAAQIPVFARLLRSSMLSQRGADYVLAAQTLGLGRGKITMSHLLPNSLGPVIVQATLALATAVIDAAALSFLGLGGGNPNTAEWGRMLTSAQNFLASAPQLAFLPGICIAITALGFTLVGESLREALDPKSRKK